MKIAFVVNNYPPRVGGVETHVASLASQLHALGHRVVVYTLHEHPGRSEESGITVVRLPEHGRIGGVVGFPGPDVAGRIARALAADGTEIVSVHTRFFPMTWVGIRAARRVGIPAVHTEHGSGHVVSESRLISLASRAVDLTAGRVALRRADVVLGVSDAVLAFVERLAARRGTPFPNAIDAPATHAPPPRPGHLVFVGRMVSGKGWDVFVDLVARLRAEGREVTGELLGDGPELAALRARVTELGLDPAVRVRGRVEPRGVRAALAGATLVNPTVLAEGFQTTLLEALAEGGRVVTYPVPGAEALRAEGRAVRVTGERDPEQLLAAVREELGTARDPGPPMDSWTWGHRASEYVEVCRVALERRRAR